MTLNLTIPSDLPPLHPGNIAGSPGSTFAGLAVMTPSVIDAVSHLQVPTTAAGWIVIVLGVLAMFGRG